MEPPYKELSGVNSVTVGYTAGRIPNPTYEQVCSGTSGHAEAVEIDFDPAKVTYEKLLETFWQNIDPTMLNGQFADRGTQYRTAIYYHDAEQQTLAEASKIALDKSGKFKRPVMTEISPASTFYPAEEYHQEYYKKCPARYESYKFGSGRQTFIERTWGKKA